MVIFVVVIDMAIDGKRSRRLKASFARNPRDI
jgi:hypothetical protein